MPDPQWRFIPITEKPDIHAFDCGESGLNDYLRSYAGQNHRNGLGSTFVLVPYQGPPSAIGYYTLCMAQAEPQSLPEPMGRKLPGYPAPAVRLARLAVDRKWQSRGLGELLMVDAIRRTVIATRSVAAKFMIVDAKNMKAREFYAKYGFISFGGAPYRLVSPIETLTRLL